MKLIVGIIRPEKLEAIRLALDEPGVPLASISQVIDGNAPRSTTTYRGVGVGVPQPRLRLEVVVVNEALVQWAIEAIARAGSTVDARCRGDGSVFVMPLDECVPIPDSQARPVAGG